MLFNSKFSKKGWELLGVIPQTRQFPKRPAKNTNKNNIETIVVG